MRKWHHIGFCSINYIVLCVRLEQVLDSYTLQRYCALLLRLCNFDFKAKRALRTAAAGSSIMKCNSLWVSLMYPIRITRQIKFRQRADNRDIVEWIKYLRPQLDFQGLGPFRDALSNFVTKMRRLLREVVFSVVERILVGHWPGRLPEAVYRNEVGTPNGGLPNIFCLFLSLGLCSNEHVTYASRVYHPRNLLPRKWHSTSLTTQMRMSVNLRFCYSACCRDTSSDVSTTSHGSLSNPSIWHGLRVIS